MFYKHPNTPDAGNPSKLDKMGPGEDENPGISEKGLEEALRYDPIGQKAGGLSREVVKLNLRQYASGTARRPRLTRPRELIRQLPGGPDDSRLSGSRELKGTVQALIPVARCSELIHNGGLVLLRNSFFAMTRTEMFEGIKCKQYYRYRGLFGASRPEQTEVLVTDVFPAGGATAEPISSEKAFRACIRVRWLVDSRQSPEEFFATTEWVTSATQAHYDRVEILNTLRGTDIGVGVLVVRKGVINRHWIKAADSKLYLAVLNGNRLEHPGKADPRVDTTGPVPPIAISLDVATKQDVEDSKKEILAAIAGN